MVRQSMVWSACIAACVFTSCASNSESHVAQTQLSEAEMTQRWMDFTTPGAGHQALEERAGTWKLEVKYWMPGATEPILSNGTSTVKWIMDGRYLEDHTEASNSMGPFEGRGFCGYDNLRKKYFATWIDNSGTGLISLVGDFDASAGAFHYKGEMPDAVSGQYVAIRQVEQRIAADRWRTEMFVQGPKGEFKCLELNYTRM